MKRDVSMSANLVFVRLVLSPKKATNGDSIDACHVFDATEKRSYTQCLCKNSKVSPAPGLLQYCLLPIAYCSIAHRKWAGWVVGWVLGGKKGSSGQAMCLTRQPGARPTAIIFWSSWLMASNVDGGDRVDCQGLVCKQGQSWGASNVCVGHFLAARCLFLCRDAFAGVCTRIGCILCWITGVQLQRDKQYLRWIFFLSDGNNPYKGSEQC